MPSRTKRLQQPPRRRNIQPGPSQLQAVVSELCEFREPARQACPQYTTLPGLARRRALTLPSSWAANPYRMTMLAVSLNLSLQTAVARCRLRHRAVGGLGRLAGCMLGSSCTSSSDSQHQLLLSETSRGFGSTSCVFVSESFGCRRTA